MTLPSAMPRTHIATVTGAPASGIPRPRSTHALLPPSPTNTSDTRAHSCASTANDKKQSTIIVAVRVKPLSSKELDHERALVRCHASDRELGEPGTVAVLDSKVVSLSSPLAHTSANTKENYFQFDHVFGATATTAVIHRSFGASIVDKLVSGENATILAYGQTGSGKTHTMTGSVSDSGETIPGLTQLLISDLYNRSQSLKTSDPLFGLAVSVSYIEIYNETIIDLLSSTRTSTGLELREDSHRGSVILGLNTVRISGGFSQIIELLDSGSKNRTVDSHRMNATSSRSHAIFTLHLTLTHTGQHCALTLIDLAGSERASKTGANKKMLKEGANINRSLLALSNCISQLAKSNNHSQHIPYRDSKLTRLLKDSLNGVSSTVMLCCVSASSEQLDETRETLFYANRAKEIKVDVSVREARSGASGGGALSDRERSVWESRVSELTKRINALELQSTATTTTVVSASNSGIGSDNQIESLQLDALLSELANERYMQRLERYHQIIDNEEGNPAMDTHTQARNRLPSPRQTLTTMTPIERLSSMLADHSSSTSLTRLQTLSPSLSLLSLYYCLYRLQCCESECEQMVQHWFKQRSQQLHREKCHYQSVLDDHSVAYPPFSDNSDDHGNELQSPSSQSHPPLISSPSLASSHSPPLLAPPNERRAHLRQTSADIMAAAHIAANASTSTEPTPTSQSRPKHQQGVSWSDLPPISDENEEGLLSINTDNVNDPLFGNDIDSPRVEVSYSYAPSDFVDDPDLPLLPVLIRNDSDSSDNGANEDDEDARSSMLESSLLSPNNRGRRSSLPNASHSWHQRSVFRPAIAVSAGSPKKAQDDEIKEADNCSQPLSSPVVIPAGNARGHLRRHSSMASEQLRQELNLTLKLGSLQSAWAEQKEALHEESASVITVD